jgi:asparagine synthase (glutamine-hydrolysing)
MYRYLALVWNSRNPEDSRAATTLAGPALPSTWSVAYQAPGIKLLRTDARQSAAIVYPLPRDSGVIFGKLFESHRDVQAPHGPSLDADETRQIVASGGRRIVERYWGSYIAIIRDQSARGHHVFRDPTGTVACYHTVHGGIDVFFSNVEDVIRCLPGPFDIDREHLTRWLYLPPLASRSTGLTGVKPLPAGECLTLLEGTRTQSRLWDPAEVARQRRFEQPDEAAHALRSTVQNTVNAWASCYENITHLLSGGLDSSVVAACLAQAPTKPRLTYLNLAIESHNAQQQVHMPGVDRALQDKIRATVSHGDERYYARLVTTLWNAPLVERTRSPELSIERLSSLPPRLNPALYFTAHELDAAKLEMIGTYGTQAFFSGQAGDSVFLATSQPLPAIDYAHQHGLRPGLWRHVLATAALSRESLWSVLGKTWSHGLLGRRYVSLLEHIERASLLPQDRVVELMKAEHAYRETQHASSTNLPPGKQLLVQGVAAAPYYDFEFHAGQRADHIDPLNAQPVWELALQIPTYTVLLDGTSRGLARHAFRDVLPAEIRKRVAKGSGSTFYQHVVRSQRNLLQQVLLDGQLVKERYLDRRKLDECLAADDPSAIIFAPILLSYLSAEIWLQQWQQVGMNSVATAPPYRMAAP